MYKIEKIENILFSSDTVCWQEHQVLRAPSYQTWKWWCILGSQLTVVFEGGSRMCYEWIKLSRGEGEKQLSLSPIHLNIFFNKFGQIINYAHCIQTLLLQQRSMGSSIVKSQILLQKIKAGEPYCFKILLSINQHGKLFGKALK